MPNDIIPVGMSEWYSTPNPRTGKPVFKRSWKEEEYEPIAAQITKIDEFGKMTITFSAEFVN